MSLFLFSPHVPSSSLLESGQVKDSKSIGSFHKCRKIGL